MMATRVVGVDIGASSVRAIEVENPGKARPTVLRYHEMALPEGSTRSGEVIETHTVASVLRQLWTAAGFTSKDVVLGMGNQRVLARDLTIPKMTATQTRESLPFQVQEMLPIPVSEAILDFYPISEGVTEAGPVINGLLVAAVKDAVLGNVNSVKLAGLNPLEVDLIPFALARLQNRGLTGGGTVAVVDVGANTTNVIVTIAGIPQFIRIIPTGGDDVDKAMIGRLELEPRLARDAKWALGLRHGQIAPEHLPLVEVIFEVTNELVNSVRNTIAYFDNTHDVPNVDRIVLSGGGSRLGGFVAALGELTRTEVIVADPFATVTMSSKAGRPDIVPDSMTVALGLALGSAA